MVFFDQLFNRISGRGPTPGQMRAARQRNVPDHIMRELVRRPAGADKTDLVQRLVNLRRLQAEREARLNKTFRGIRIGDLEKILNRNRR